MQIPRAPQRCHQLHQVSDTQVNHILENLTAKGLEWVRIEKLYTFDNERAYALFEGELCLKRQKPPGGGFFVGRKVS